MYRESDCAKFHGGIGSYPEKAPPSKLIPKSADGKDHFVGGSEGFAVVEEIASKSKTDLRPGDWGKHYDLFANEPFDVQLNVLACLQSISAVIMAQSQQGNILLISVQN